MREIAELVVTEVQLMLDKHSIVLKVPRAPVPVSDDVPLTGCTVQEGR